MKKLPESISTLITAEQINEHNTLMVNWLLTNILDYLSAKYPKERHRRVYRPYTIVNKDQYEDLRNKMLTVLGAARDQCFIANSLLIALHDSRNISVKKCYARMTARILDCFDYKKNFGKDKVTVDASKFRKEMVLDAVDEFFDTFQQLASQARYEMSPKQQPPTPSAPQLIKQNPNAPARMFSTSPKPLQKPPTPPDLNSSAIFAN